ncbi:hypothetical protein PVAP13_1NG414919 [Panicum virgatum]|uniref:Uncharacterized protein n=1 Tax=Panicum virgatum TaxID=38727 RepID=A0A8T0X4S3_PANVG|nr:hypothetical protein PVAP13_1NG414919 [Panicum virgatum]
MFTTSVWESPVLTKKSNRSCSSSPLPRKDLSAFFISSEPSTNPMPFKNFTFSSNDLSVLLSGGKQLSFVPKVYFINCRGSSFIILHKCLFPTLRFVRMLLAAFT